MKTLFVTGAEGFTGSRLVRYLRKQGYEVVGGVRNRARKLAFERQHGKALVCDVSDAINVARAVASVKPDGIIHLAGVAQVQHAAAEPLSAYQSIVTAWANVLDAVRRVVPRARVVLVSSADVYGNAGNDGQPLREDAQLSPVTTFGSLKAAAESIAHTFHNNYHTHVSIARPFQYVGAGQSDSFFYASVAQRVANWDAGSQGNQFELPDLQCRRDVMHVDDVVAALATILDAGQANAAYNICSGQARTVREIVEQIVRASGSALQLADLAADEPAAIECLCGDNARLRELGWQPVSSFEQGISELTASFQKQQAPAPI